MKSLVVGAMLLRTMNAQIPAGNAVPAVAVPAVPAVPAFAVPAAVPLGNNVAPVITPVISAPVAPIQPALPLVPAQGLAPAVPAGLNPLRSAIAAVASGLSRPSAPGSGFGAFAAPVEELLPPVDGELASIVAAPGVTPAPLLLGAAAPIGSNPYVGPYDPNSIYDPTSPYYDPYAKPAGWEGDDNGNYEGEDDYYPLPGGPSYPGYEKECPAWCLHEDDSYPKEYPDYEYSPYKPSSKAEYPEYSSVADPYKTTPEYSPYPTPTPYKEKVDYKEEPEYYPEPEDKKYPQLKKARSILRAVRRQVYKWGQPGFNDDDDSGSYDGEDGSIPDWLYELDGAPKKPTRTPQSKPKCPKSCYKPKTKDYGYDSKPARPTYTKTRKGYKTSEDPYKTTEDPYQATRAPYGDEPSSVWYPQSNSSIPYGPTSVPDDSTSVPDESTSFSDVPTSVPDEPTSIPDEPTSVPSEPTDAPYEPYEPTTLVTQYQPQPYPAETGYPGSDSYKSSDPGSPAGDYTGETLDTICPNTCNPFNPAENFCDITTGCATTGGSKYYCACRAGYRADNYNAKDFSKQFKVPGQPYVYLAVSTTCGTLCSDSTCSEVLERPHCK